jgi:hypothetical protein
MDRKDIDTIYEFYRNAQTIEDSNNKYTPGLSHPKYSAEWPGIRGNGRDMVKTPIPEAEEDFEVTVGQIKKKVQELLQKSEEDGMTYATDHLMELVKFIK